MFTKKQVEDMAEKDLRSKIIIPLLKAMKYQDVRENHGPTEYGKDIICWDTDKLGNRENTAVVVKAVAVSGQSSVSADIEHQVKQCFSKPYTDPVTGSEEFIDRCFVISNKPISSTAVDMIKSGIGNAVYVKNVTFISSDRLWELIEKHMPLQATLQKLEDVRHDLNTWDTHYRMDVLVNKDGIYHHLSEKFPGASQEKPLTIRTRFEFPDTEDGKEHAKAIERLYEAGTSARIPATYVKSLVFPEELQKVIPSLTESGFIQLGSLPHAKPFPMKCKIICDDGDSFAIDYIHLIRVQGGQKEITLTNEGQAIPFKIDMVVHFDGSIADLEISLNHNSPHNVHQQLLQMQFMSCASKPNTIRVISLETGLQVFSCRNEAGISEPPDVVALESIVALDALQRKSGILVYLPERDLTDEEYKCVSMLRALYRTGKIGFTWNESSSPIIITSENREELKHELEQLAEVGGVASWGADETLSLFGNEYPLGPIKPLWMPIKLANWSEIRDLLDSDFSGEYRVKFVPRDEGHFIKEYVQWLPKGDSSSMTAATAGADASIG